ncbi:hypothetical protein [Thermaerobacter sp. PB12/4term]|uniref:hypothetical protein n=1 Tax=Thermaerobacter sp. PB12/4term TaxID=2293838 RepID=UPI00193F23A4|nr:hypothetical protein [Thermaerobacter sp. PB12/4term]
MPIEEETVKEALDPGVFVRVRRVTGGPAPEEVRRMLAARGQVQASPRAWVEERRAALQRAEAELDRACRELAADGAGA